MLEITYELECLPEDTPIRGNAVATDDAAIDRQTEAYIERQLRDGNEWAWCCVKVTATCGGFLGEAFLGCCSYASRRDFEKSGGLDDLKAEAKEDLINTLRKAKARGHAAALVLKKLKEG